MQQWTRRAVEWVGYTQTQQVMGREYHDGSVAYFSEDHQSGDMMGLTSPAVRMLELLPSPLDSACLACALKLCVLDTPAPPPIGRACCSSSEIRCAAGGLNICRLESECDTACVEEGGGGEMGSVIVSPSWIRRGGRGGGPIDPIPCDALES